MYKPPYQPSVNAGSGAKKGLEQKMEYWKDKDFQYEFGVTLGQAWNLAYQRHHGVDAVPTREAVMEVFQRILASRLDPEFVETFAEYFEQKKNRSEVVNSNRDKLPIVRID